MKLNNLYKTIIGASIASCGLIPITASCSPYSYEVETNYVSIAGGNNIQTSNQWAIIELNFEKTPTDKLAYIYINAEEEVWTDYYGNQEVVDNKLTITLKFRNTQTVYPKTCKFTLQITYPYDNHSYVEKKECTLTFRQTAFNTDSWDTVNSYASQGLDALKQHYQLNSFLGEIRTITLNGKEHKVRVIGEGVDHFSDNTTAALTFELVTLVSDSNGDAIKTNFDDYNYNVVDSILRANIIGEPSSKKSFSKTVLEMFQEGNPTLFGCLQTVRKQTKAYVNGSWTTVTYNDKLFVPTSNEIEGEWSATGQTYPFWTVSTSNDYRIKYDSNGKATSYWLSDSNGIIPIGTDGGVQAMNQYGSLVLAGLGAACKTSSLGISFCFCL